jgi:1-phosphofructokinase
MNPVRVAVFDPAPLITVTIEHDGAPTPEIHFHAGGQGFWVAHMAAELGASVVFCCALGGESGRVLAGLLEDAPGIEVRAVRSTAENGAYVHDRRGGERVTVAEMPGGRLSRHALDELYGVIVTAGLDCNATLLTGPQDNTFVDPDIYRRLARDLRSNHHRALADLSGENLLAALEGGVELAKLNDDQAVATGLATGTGHPQLVDALRRMRRSGARNAVLTRGAEPALALIDDELVELEGPHFDALDPRGSGDSMFATLGVATASGRPLVEGLRMAAAAGALNATRHGLGSGHRSEIARLADHVSVRPAPS